MGRPASAEQVPASRFGTGSLLSQRALLLLMVCRGGGCARAFYQVLVLVAVCFLPPAALLFAQESPVREKEKPNTPLQRELWFYEQRAYPLGRIPPGARLRALEEMDRMIELERVQKLMAAPGPFVVPPPPSAATWTHIGPQPTNNPFFTPFTSGRVSALAICPSNNDIVYVGGAQGGVWKTIDGGTTWTPQTDNQPSLAVGSLAIVPTNCDTVYAGTGEGVFSFDSYYGAGVLKTTNGGMTWTQVAGPGQFIASPFCSSRTCGGPRIKALAVKPDNANIVLAAVQVVSNVGGIFRSTDGGVTWIVVKGHATDSTLGAPGTAVVFDPASPMVAYAALGQLSSGNTNNGVYKSTDGGATWNPANGTGLNVLPSGTSAGRIELTIGPGVVYASIADPASTSSNLLGFFKTINGGTDWTRPMPGPPDFCTPQCWYDHVIRADPANANNVLVGGSAVSGYLSRSTDGGQNWAAIESDGTRTIHVDQHALGLNNDGSGLVLYVGNDGGVWKTANPFTAVSWQNLNATLSLVQFYPGIFIHPTNANLAFGGTQDNGTQRFNNDTAWEFVTCGDGAYAAINPTDTNFVYANCQNIDVRRSTSGGAQFTFSRIDNTATPIDSTDRVRFIPPLVLDLSNPSNLYFGTFRVWQTTNATAVSPSAPAWTAISPDLTTPSTSATITTIAVAPSESNTVYAGTTNSKVWVTSNALAGAGAAWNDRSTGLPPRVITMITVDPLNSMTAYVTFSGFSGFGGDTQGHVFKTTNAGMTWSDISGNLLSMNIPVNDIVVDPDLANTLYVATDIGVFRTTDGGTNWSVLGSGLPRVAVFSLKLHRASRTLRAATHGRGMWDLSVPAATNPVPAITGLLSSSSLPIGATGLTLNVIGTDFLSTSVVRWNGLDRTTTFIGSKHLTAFIPASDIATAGSAQITVFNPAPGGGTSNATSFTFNPSPGLFPMVAALAPASVPAGRTRLTLTVYGANFVPGSVVRWNGANRATRFLSSTQLQVKIPASDLARRGSARVTVFNAGEGGGTSNGLTFRVESVPVRRSAPRRGRGRALKGSPQTRRTEAN